MFDFSERFLRLFLLTANGLFIASGLGMIILGIYKNATEPKKLDADMLDSQSDGVTTIIAGCMGTIIGTCGVVGAVLNKRILLIANVALLGTAIFGNLIVLIVVGAATGRIASTATNNMKEAILSQYGNNSDTDSKDFTLAVEEHQKADPCCGWTGIDGENLFLKTAWYKQINLNVTTVPRTLPDSCCITAGDDCRATEDVKAARKLGYVNADDCIDNIVGRAKVFMWTTIIQVLVVTLMQVVIVAFSVLSLVKNPE